MQYMNDTNQLPLKPLFDPSDATIESVLRNLFAADKAADLLPALGWLNEAGALCPLVPHADGKSQPDEASPLVWVYPLEAYQQAGAEGFPTAKQVFEDWFMRSAVDAGLPVATVVSAGNLVTILAQNPDAVRGRILVTPYPTPDSPWEAAVMQHARSGGQLLVYGKALPGKLARQLGLHFGSSLQDALDLFTHYDPDESELGEPSTRIFHNPSISDGGIDVTDAAYPLATVMQGFDARVYAARSGSVVWVRGTLSAHGKAGNARTIPHKPNEYYNTGRLLRYVLEEFGISLRFGTVDVNHRLPAVLLHRQDGALYASASSPAPAVMRISTPIGAPVLTGCEAQLLYGEAVYALHSAAHCEIRAFVKQDCGAVACHEEETGCHRLEGLVNADVYWLRSGDAATFQLASPDGTVESLQATREQTALGEMLLAQNVTGTLVVR